MLAALEAWHKSCLRSRAGRRLSITSTADLHPFSSSEALWLCSIEDRRRLDSSREGMFCGLSIGNF